MTNQPPRTAVDLNVYIFAADIASRLSDAIGATETLLPEDSAVTLTLYGVNTTSYPQVEPLWTLYHQIEGILDSYKQVLNLSS